MAHSLVAGSMFDGAANPTEIQRSSLYEPPTQPLGSLNYPPVSYEPPHPPPYWPPPVPKSAQFNFKAEDNECVAPLGSYCALTATLARVVTPCPENSFCTGIGVSLPVKCPQGSDTRGLLGQGNCTCLPGYRGGITVGTPGCVACLLNHYCPDGFQMISCPPIAKSDARSTSLQSCVCPPGNEILEGACITNCVAAPGSYCAPQASSLSSNPSLVSTQCPDGSYCPGGRGADKITCPAGFGCPGPLRPAPRSCHRALCTC